MNQEQTENADLERVKQACNTLIDHFDTVMIFTTRHESGELDGTVNVRYGLGNWFARKGQVEEWLKREDESTRVQVRKESQE